MSSGAACCLWGEAPSLSKERALLEAQATSAGSGDSGGPWAPTCVNAPVRCPCTSCQGSMLFQLWPGPGDGEPAWAGLRPELHCSYGYFPGGGPGFLQPPAGRVEGLQVRPGSGQPSGCHTQLAMGT